MSDSTRVLVGAAMTAVLAVGVTVSTTPVVAEQEQSATFERQYASAVVHACIYIPELAGPVKSNKTSVV